MLIINELLQHKLLLDTHVWIWLMEGNSILSSHFRSSLEHAQRHEGILISAISVWEIGMLTGKKRIALEMDTLDWIEIALSAQGVKLIALKPKISIQSCRLPGQLHADPADRLLVATAHEENAVLITCDKKLLAYGQDQFISVYNPCANGS
jgi:PIN domain nuclease of toxin-antitoxin system